RCHGRLRRGLQRAGWRDARSHHTRRRLPTPHEAWLAIRGMRTVALRMRRQCESALVVARHLAKHPKVARVRYPGLADHPQHELATRQFGGLYGGVVSFALRDDTKPAAFRFLDALDLAASATTIGD